jgi:hypothetical protein
MLLHYVTAQPHRILDTMIIGWLNRPVHGMVVVTSEGGPNNPFLASYLITWRRENIQKSSPLALNSSPSSLGSRGFYHPAA